jgi:hypothetical protein
MLLNTYTYFKKIKPFSKAATLKQSKTAEPIREGKSPAVLTQNTALSFYFLKNN